MNIHILYSIGDFLYNYISLLFKFANPLEIRPTRLEVWSPPVHDQTIMTRRLVFVRVHFPPVSLLNSRGTELRLGRARPFEIPLWSEHLPVPPFSLQISSFDG